MLKIGITGGIGSGKSTVCKIWQSLGAFVINADDLAKELMVKNETVKKEVTDVFGKDSFHPDGSLNRKYLSNEAFNKGRVEELNNIVHPAVIKEASKMIEGAEEQGFQTAVYEAALLLQKGRPDNLDHIVLVLADEEKRIDRVSKRDKVDRAAVISRASQQQEFETLTSLADFIIRNNGNQKQFELKAREVYKELIERNN